ncbi:MAG: response regulator [Burkholderiaceae bacterium]
MSSDAPTSSGLVAMIVDDDEVDQMMYQRVFSRCAGFGSVIGCTQPEEALRQLQDPKGRPIDVLFLDINMPRMDGFEFLERANREQGAHFAKTAVVMLTTSLDDADRRRVRKYPQVKAYISKPLTTDALDELVRDLAE